MIVCFSDRDVDVSCYNSVAAAAEKVLQTLGRVDILINNAGDVLSGIKVGETEVGD